MCFASTSGAIWRTVARAVCAMAILFAGAVSIARATDVAAPKLNGTYWKLVEMDGAAAHFGQGSREAHIQFGERNRISGSGGCNRLLGGYRMDGVHLTFGNLGGTMMECDKGMNEERHMVQSLAKVRGWRIEGPQLVMLAESGAVILRFQSGEPSL